MDFSDNASLLSTKGELPADMVQERFGMEFRNKIPRDDASVSQHTTEVPSIGNADRLEALLASLYPQYARVQYIPVEVHLDEFIGSNDRGNGQSSPNLRYRCKVFLFEMLLECRDSYLTLEEAKEAVASIAIDLLTQFNFVIQSRSTENRFGVLFQPLIEEMTKTLTSHALDPAEEDRAARGHQPITSVERYKDVGSLDLQKGILSANLSAIYEKMNVPGTAQHDAPKPAPAPAPSQPLVPKKLIMPSTKEALMDPLSAIHSYYQKRAGACDAPDFQIFEGRNRTLFGCIGKFDGKSYIAEGIYRTKKEAKKAAAALICQDVFGVSIPASDFDTAVSSKDAVLASSFGVKGTSTTFGHGFQMAPEKINPAVEKIFLEPPSGKKYISLVNECCQINKLSQPDYQCHTEDSISSYFIIHALNTFDEATIQRIGGQISPKEEVPKRFISATFTRKNDAKEDCAARIYFFLRDHGVFDESGLIKKAAISKLSSWKNESICHEPLVQQLQPQMFPPALHWSFQMPSQMAPQTHVPPLPKMPLLDGVAPLPPFPFPTLPIPFIPPPVPMSPFPPIPPVILDRAMRPNNTTSRTDSSPRFHAFCRSSSKSPPNDDEPRDPRSRRSEEQ